VVNRRGRCQVTELKIEKGIAPPVTATELIRSMEVGDSIKFPTYKHIPGSLMTKLKPRKFTQRQETDGVRLWRIA
jgi:hypothetical protein